MAKHDCEYGKDMDIRHFKNNDGYLEYPNTATRALKPFWGLGIVQRFGIGNPLVDFEVICKVEYCPICGKKLGGR